MTTWLVALAAWCGTLLGPGDADPACLLLGRLDAVRAEAFVRADASRLDHVYASQRLRDADAQVLRAWSDRGLRLEGMGQLRSSCAVVDRSPQRVTLDVVDRLGPTRAVGERGRVLGLPADRPTRRAVVLVLGDDGWRILATG